MRQVLCDRCQARAPIGYTEHALLPVGWSLVHMVFTEEQAPPAHPDLAAMAEAIPMPEGMREAVGTMARDYQRAAFPPQLPTPVDVLRRVELCPDCTDRLVEASGCARALRARP
jgi:hypothetical protein